MPRRGGGGGRMGGSRSRAFGRRSPFASTPQKRNTSSRSSTATAPSSRTKTNTPASTRNASPTNSRGVSSKAMAPAAATGSAANKQNKTNSATTPATQQQQQTAPTSAAGGGGGMVKGIMANAASYAMGMTMARGIDRALWGGGGSSSNQDEDGAALPMEGGEEDINGMSQQQQQSYYQTSSNDMQDGMRGYGEEENECAMELRRFKDCLKGNGGDALSCQWNYDALLTCQRAQQGNGFAAAPQF